MRFNFTNTIKNKIKNIQKADQKKILKIKDIELISAFEKLLAMDDTVVNAMTESMKNEGFKPGHELHIWAHDGNYILIDGHTRRFCAIKAGLTSVPCIIHHFKSITDARAFALKEQITRRNLSGEALLQAVANFNFEKAKVILVLKKEKPARLSVSSLEFLPRLLRKPDLYSKRQVKSRRKAFAKMSFQ
ncbi:ParB N-terminal domain-containing protein [uncultured Treponema sp.]|uniref:ParB N-terminal domain-containing protein n=1 Tax=uncultured Treponema sp. TaxID=162155 RepID=UPI0025CCA814|nr:ParB N-terminal domain-containing protein [uncultured Treponema sp.]